ncbi:MAG: hypothetical protein GXO86_04285 [Chlorobi bacterium]|nr:hypothetical protein [Chlorobiota bacterium]
MLTKEKIREIIIRQIESDEKPEEQAGGSGHLAFKSFKLNGFDTKQLDNSRTEVKYRYTVFIETEFTVLPDNPPREYKYKKTIIIDKGGNIE